MLLFKFDFKKLPKLLGQIIAIALITFVMAEITFRIYNLINPSFIFYSRSYNRNRAKPGAPVYDTGFKINSKGFKDLEFTAEKPANTYRILGIGDSFSYGIVPYPNNYLTILEDKLNQGRNNKVEVINMGIPGMGPQDYLSILVNEGLQLNPDMVVVTFYIGNDFMDNTLLRLKEANEGKSFYSYSYVASFFRVLMELKNNYKGEIFHPGNMKYVDSQATFSDDKYLQLMKDRVQTFVKNPAVDMFQATFDDAVDDLVKIKKICDSKKINLVIAIAPDEIQVNSALQVAVAKSLNARLDALDFTKPNRMLVEALQKNNIKYVDLLPDFTPVAKQVVLYRKNDTHWNIAGNQLAAEKIYQTLSPEIPK